MISRIVDEPAARNDGVRARLLVAEDHALVREGLRLLVSTCPDLTIVGETGDGAAVTGLIRELHPDVCLLDLGLPGVDGLSVLDTITREALPVRVLVVTARLDAASVHASLALGAAGYLTKNESSDALLTAIRTVAAGGCHVSPAIAALAEDGRPAAALMALTGREREIVALVATGLPSKTIALRLAVAERTVRKHRENICRKIGAHNSAEMVAFALRCGLGV